jgi:hypothetical protein
VAAAHAAIAPWYSPDLLGPAAAPAAFPAARSAGDSNAPVERTLRSFAVNLQGNPTFADILHQARGEKAEVALANAGAGALSGTIIGVERQRQRQRQQVNKEVVEQQVLNLWCADGMRSVKLSEVQRRQGAQRPRCGRGRAHPGRPAAGRRRRRPRKSATPAACSASARGGARPTTLPAPAGPGQTNRGGLLRHELRLRVEELLDAGEVDRLRAQQEHVPRGRRP